MTKVGSATARLRSEEGLPVLIIETKGEIAQEIRGHSSAAPVIGWVSGYTIVGGLLHDDEAEQYEVLTEQGQVLRGKLNHPTYLLTWKAPESKRRFMLRILNAEGQEIYRWPPFGGPPAAEHQGGFRS